MTALHATSTQFKAFADPTRLRILSLLLEGELCVCHIVDILGEVQPKVSRHLAILREAGLVQVRKEGNWRHYALPDDTDCLTTNLLGCVGTSLRSLDELREDLRRLRAIEDPVGEAAPH